LLRLQHLLVAGGRIEWRIVQLQWIVMLLVGAGAVMPGALGSDLERTAALLLLVLLAAHPLAYFGIAIFWYNWLRRQPEVRIAIYTALDVSVAVGVLFLTSSSPGYTQVLLFSVVLLAATRYSLSRAMAITTLISILQIFSIIAVTGRSIPITSVSSAVVAMFALTYGVNLLRVAERMEAAIATENGKLYAAVLLRNRELATINALSQAATVDTDPDRLLESGLELILSAMAASWGQAFRYDRRSGEIELLFIRQAALSQPAMEQAAAARQEALQVVRSHTSVVGPALSLRGERVARVSAPIFVQGNVVGVLQMLVPAEEVAEHSAQPAESLAIICQELGTWVEKAQLREAAQRTLVLEEKNRIAQELHDTVLQILFSTGLTADLCQRRLHDEQAVAQGLAEIRALTAKASSELRSAIFTVSSQVAEVGLVEAITTLTTTFSDQYKLPTSFSAVGDFRNLTLLQHNALHRVVRESLMNAYKHARAHHVATRLVEDRGTVTVIVQDDGVGIQPEVLEHYPDDSGHFGLRTIAQQIADLQGRFEVMNGEEGGVIIRATVLVKPENGEANRARARAN
jgi:signal transduction histidine kinase